MATYNDFPIACKELIPKVDDEETKTMSDALKKKDSIYEEFISEAKVLAQIPPSPFVVRLFGLCLEPFCILTEFIAGMNEMIIKVEIENN